MESLLDFVDAERSLPPTAGGVRHVRKVAEYFVEPLPGDGVLIDVMAPPLKPLLNQGVVRSPGTWDTLLASAVAG